MSNKQNEHNNWWSEFLFSYSFFSFLFEFLGIFGDGERYMRTHINLAKDPCSDPSDKPRWCSSIDLLA